MKLLVMQRRQKHILLQKCICIVVPVRLQVRLIVNNVHFFDVTLCVCVCVRACVEYNFVTGQLIGYFQSVSELSR